MVRKVKCDVVFKLECVQISLKTYNLKKFSSVEELKNEIKQYIYYYNNERIKSNLNKLSPIQYRTQFYNN